MKRTLPIRRCDTSMEKQLLMGYILEKILPSHSRFRLIAQLTECEITRLFKGRILIILSGEFFLHPQ